MQGGFFIYIDFLVASVIMNNIMTGKLYIVATPIGNLGDITLRAIATLKEVSCIFCEDTRVTKNLLNHFEIKTPVESYHQHSDIAKYRHILDMLMEGKSLALVSDAGTPGISDPGNELVEYVRSHIKDTEIVVPIPGVSAVATALSVSGFPTDKFIFMGFPPHKNKRNKYFAEMAQAKYTVIFYESSHRIGKALSDMSNALPPDTKIFIARELTKKFESFYSGKLSDVIGMAIPDKGEFVVIVRHET